jgi:hypothetical protein
VKYYVILWIEPICPRIEFGGQFVHGYAPFGYIKGRRVDSFSRWKNRKTGMIPGRRVC